MKSLLQSFFSFLKSKPFPSKEDRELFQNEPFSLFKAGVFLIGIIGSVFFLLFLLHISRAFSLEEPASGGTLTVGVIGAPRFINPFLSSSQSDETLIKLLYSPLVTKTETGILVPVLADHFIASPDGKEYRFTLKNNLRFSDKKILTSADVVYSFETKRSFVVVANPESEWKYITVSAPDNQTVVIQTTGQEDLRNYLSLPIVPKALWSAVDTSLMKDSTLNMNPVGAGPFVLKKISYTNTIPKEFILERNPLFVGEKPFIKKIKIVIFSNQLDLKEGLLNNKIALTSMLQNTFVDSVIKDTFSVQEVPTKKEVSIFVSSSGKNAVNAQALSLLSPFIDRFKIIDIIGNGYGVALPSLGATVSTNDTSNAGDILTRSGFVKDTATGILNKSTNQIKLSLALKKDDALIDAANELSRQLFSFGIMTELKVFDQGLFADQMREGGYQFILGTSTDALPGYQTLIPLYQSVMPVLSHGVTIETPRTINTESELFESISHWYIRKDMVWKIFKK